MSTASELPHDLLEIAAGAPLTCDGARPWWVPASLERAPFVVVRRAPERDGLVPVGLRGARRNERLAAWVARRHVVRRIRPEDLAERRAWRGQTSVVQLAALDGVAAAVEELGLAWGPTGSTGFQLATGIPCIDVASDVDVVVRAPGALPRSDARRLLAALAPLAVRVDVQVETAAGAIALAELASAATRVVLRTPGGPILVASPALDEPPARTA